MKVEFILCADIIDNKGRMNGEQIKLIFIGSDWQAMPTPG